MPAAVACTENAPDRPATRRRRPAPRGAHRSSTDAACDALGRPRRRPAPLTFDVTNTGDQVTEFYLLGETACGSSARSRTSAPASAALVVTRPPVLRHRLQAGMIGEGIRADFTVTESDEAAPRSPSTTRTWSSRPRTNYAAYVQDQSDQLAGEDRSSSSTPTRRATTTAARALYAARASTGSGSRPWPSPSATSTRRWTPARPTSSRARSGPAGTGSRRTCGRARRGLPALTAEERATYADDLLPTPRPSTSGSRSSSSPSTRSPTARAACSRRSPPARSPARRSTGRTPTCGTSRPTSTAPASATRACSRSSRSKDPELAGP